MKKVLLPLAFISLLAVSCKKDDNPAPAGDAYVSLTTNNKWIYDNIEDPGTASSVTTRDTVTALSTSITFNGRTYRILRSNQGDSTFQNVSGSDYYELQEQDFGSGPVTVENIYLKDNQAVGTNWSQTLNLSSGLPAPFPPTIPITITNTITEKGVAKTVLGTSYTDVITVKTDITSSSPLVTGLTTDIKSYYARRVGLIQGDYNIVFPTASLEVHTQTLLRSATIQ